MIRTAANSPKRTEGADLLLDLRRVIGPQCEVLAIRRLNAPCSMDPQLWLERPLTDQERAALQHYGADSTFLHAAVQHRGADFGSHPEWADFTSRCAELLRDLDSAILTSRLLAAARVYSGHGNAFAVRGSLDADPSAFVGMTYRYPGYISTSVSREFCQEFLDKRRRRGSRPVLMTFELPAGLHAIDMKHGGHHGEFEFLLGRDLSFRISGASLEDGDVLCLTLEAVGREPAADDL